MVHYIIGIAYNYTVNNIQYCIKNTIISEFSSSDVFDTLYLCWYIQLFMQNRVKVIISTIVIIKHYEAKRQYNTQILHCTFWHNNEHRETHDKLYAWLRDDEWLIMDSVCGGAIMFSLFPLF